MGLHDLPPFLPASVGLTHLRVYSSVGPGGLAGGSPHVHLACTECYYVQSGRGRVQLLSAAGFEELPLEPGGVVWFSPGVIHRLINDDGNLEIFVVMQNSGLPEAGDFVITMPQDILRDHTDYFANAAISSSGEVFADKMDAAVRRRDLAVKGFQELVRQFEKRGAEALSEFYTEAANLTSPQLAKWRAIWRSGSLLAAQQAGARIDALESGDISHLWCGSAQSLPPPGEPAKLGMCGLLGTYQPEGIRRDMQEKVNNLD